MEVASYLLFVWTPTDYQLVEREGEPPAAGETVEESDRSLRVTKLGASPLPGDDRRCAHLHPA